MVNLYRKRLREYAMSLLVFTALAVIITATYFHQIQALLPIAALLLALRIFLTSTDANVRRLSGILSFCFGASTLSNVSWYLVPAMVSGGFVDTAEYYYVTGMFWLIGYVAISYVLLKMKNSRQWYIDRSLDRLITAIAVIGFLLVALLVFPNLRWDSPNVIDILILLVYLCLDIVILTLTLKLVYMDLKSDLKRLVHAIMLFFGINMLGDLLFECRWLFGLSSMVSFNIIGAEWTLNIRNTTDLIYEVSLLLMTGYLFFCVIDPFRSHALDDARRRLKDTRLFVDDLVAKSPDATCICGRDGRLLVVNDSFLRTFGLERKAISNSCNLFGYMSQIISDEGISGQISGVSNGETVIIPRIRISNIKGGRKGDFYINLKMFPTLGANGRIINYVLIIEDITERVLAEEALRESEEKFRALTDLAPVAICILQDGRFMYANSAMEAISGYSKEDLSSISFLEMVHPDALNYIQGRYDEWLAGDGNGEFRSVLKGIRKDGDVCWIDLSRKNIDYQGRPAILITGIDITDRRYAEEALRESEEKFRSLVENINDMVWETDADGKCTYASPKTRDIMGYEPGELLGKTPFDFMIPEDAERISGAFRQFRALQAPFGLLEYTIIRKDGSHATLETNGVPMFHQDGRFKGYRGINRDVTERVRLEKELIDAYHSLKEEYRRKTDFTNAAAHELRTPLTPIIGYTEILKSEIADERHRKYLEIIERNAIRQKNMVNRMLELASLDAGMATVNRTEFPLRPLVNEVADNYRTVNPDIRVDVPEGLRVTTDADAIRHILDNLVSNAVKYSSNGGPVEIRVAEEADRYRFSVKDRGTGIPREEWDRIFERFYLVGGDKDNRTGGRIGLGLALVKAYVNLIGGTVWLESEPGQGSTFYFTVPKEKQPAGEAANVL
ncbi:MAG: aerobic respiration control sensor protein ArcB [Methanocella sp. PtaU1.Bin125]|nr:MAG: aerobic respiration control sensor protein ArcB [Methanocella sp. PtaU1.Bin125]